MFLQMNLTLLCKLVPALPPQWNLLLHKLVPELNIPSDTPIMFQMHCALT